MTIEEALEIWWRKMEQNRFAMFGKCCLRDFAVMVWLLAILTPTFVWARDLDSNQKQMANGVAITECQLLFSEEEVASQGIARQRVMYPPSSRKRLSDSAVRDGFNAATRNEAMREFNRAWRFNPENPMAFWGAGIVRGCEALKSTDRDISRQCWQDSVTLFEKGSSLLKSLSSVQQCEFQIDMAVTYGGYGQFLQQESLEQAKVYFEKAEAIFLKYHNCSIFQPEQNRAINIRVIWELKKMYSDWGKSDEAEKYDKLFYKTTTEQERKSILKTVQHSRWDE